MKNRIICICLIALLIFTVGIGKPIEVHAAVSEVVLVSALILATLSSLGVTYTNTGVDSSVFQNQFTEKISDYLTNIGIPIATALSYFTVNNNGSITAGTDAINLVSGYYQNLRGEYINNGSAVLAKEEFQDTSLSINNALYSSMPSDLTNSSAYININNLSSNQNIYFGADSDYFDSVYLIYYTYNGGGSQNGKNLAVLVCHNANDLSYFDLPNTTLFWQQSVNNNTDVVSNYNITKNNIQSVYEYYPNYSFYQSNLFVLDPALSSAQAFHVGSFSSFPSAVLSFLENSVVSYDTVSVNAASFDNTVISNVAAYQGNYVADIVISGVASADQELLVDTVYTGVIENTFTGTATIADANISSGSVSNTYEDPTGAERELNIPIVDDIINWLLKIWQKLCEIFNRLVQGFQDLINKLNDLLLAITQGFTLVSELLGDFFDIIGNYAQSLIDIVYSIVRFPNLFAAYLPPVWANFFGTVTYLVTGIWIFRFIINR